LLLATSERAMSHYCPKELRAPARIQSHSVMSAFGGKAGMVRTWSNDFL